VTRRRESRGTSVCNAPEHVASHVYSLVLFRSGFLVLFGIVFCVACVFARKVNRFLFSRDCCLFVPVSAQRRHPPPLFFFKRTGV